VGKSLMLFYSVPTQRNSRTHNSAIKQGDTPSEWTDKQAAHKDVDAFWTKKNHQNHCDYKGHINIDTKLITQWVASNAIVHDSA
jgi:hypothetical protein